MPCKFNNKFAYSTFEEEAKAFNAPVHVLTYQGASVIEELNKNGVYRPEFDKSRTEDNGYWYQAVVKKYGYLPIWVFNPLQFGETPSGTWDPKWFDDGSLWRRFLEVGGLSEEIINKRMLLELVVHSTELMKDITLDYGFISVIKEIKKEQLVGTYKLVYDEDSVDWFYPTIYPNKFNRWNSTFKKITNFKID